MGRFSWFRLSLAIPVEALLLASLNFSSKLDQILSAELKGVSNEEVTAHHTWNPLKTIQGSTYPINLVGFIEWGKLISFSEDPGGSSIEKGLSLMTPARKKETEQGLNGYSHVFGLYFIYWITC